MKLFNNFLKFLVSIFIVNFISVMCFENTNTALMNNKNTFTENSKLNGGIFMTERVFKYKNVKKARAENRHNTRYTSNIQNNNGLNLNSGIKTQTTLNKKAKMIDGNQPILFRAWIKYFKYSDGIINTPVPKGFNFNPEFYEQKKYYPNDDYQKRNKEGQYDFIRDKNYFYLTLFQKALVFNSNKIVNSFINLLKYKKWRLLKKTFIQISKLVYNYLSIFF